MNNKSVDRFFSNEEGKRIQVFFQVIVNYWNKWDYVVFISKRGYWLFLIACAYYNWDIDKKKIRSDRYVMKDCNPDFAKEGVKFALVDESMNTGYALFRVYKKIRKTYGKADIEPLVGCLGVKDIKNEQISTTPDIDRNEIEEFKKCVKNMFLVSDEAIGELSYKIIEMTQEQMIPYVVDLPFLVDKSFKGENYLDELRNTNSEIGKRTSKISKEVFYDLIEKNDVWRYNDISYRLPEDRKLIRCGFFSDIGTELQSSLGDCLVKPIIKCRYEFCSHNEIEVIFTPFVILHHIDYDEACKIFERMYGGTKYYKEVMKLTAEDAYIAVYRDIAYFLSLFLGKKFSAFIERRYNIQIKQDTSLLPHSSSKAFRDIVSEMTKWQEELFLEKIYNIKVKRTVCTMIFNTLEPGDYQEKLKLSYVTLFDKMIDKKRSGENVSNFKIEEMIECLFDKISFSSYSALKDCLIGVLLRMLDQSIWGNILELNNGVIERGFIYEENSDVILPYYNSYLFFALDLLFQRLIEEASDAAVEDLENNVKLFFTRFLKYLERKNYLDVLISIDDYQRNEKYFCVEWDLMGKLIRNKRFLLQNLDLSDSLYIEIYDFVIDMEII